MHAQASVVRTHSGRVTLRILLGFSRARAGHFISVLTFLFLGVASMLMKG